MKFLLLLKFNLVDGYLGKKLWLNFFVNFVYFFFVGLPLIVGLGFFRFLDFFLAYTIKMPLVIIFLVKKDFKKKIRNFFFSIVHFFIFWLFPINVKKIIFLVVLLIVFKESSNIDFLNWNTYNTVKPFDLSKDNTLFKNEDVNFFDFRKTCLQKFLMVESDVVYSKTSSFLNYNTKMKISKDYNRYQRHKLFIDKPRTSSTLKTFRMKYGMNWPLNLSSLDYWVLRRVYAKGWLPFDQIIDNLNNNYFFFFISKLSIYFNIFLFEGFIADGFFIILKYNILDFFLNFKYFDFYFLNLKESICFFFLTIDDYFLLNLIVILKLFFCSLFNLIFEDLMGIFIRISHYFYWDFHTIESYMPLRSVLDRRTKQVKNRLNHKLFKSLNQILYNYFITKNINSNFSKDYNENEVNLVLKGGVKNLFFKHYKHSRAIFGIKSLTFWKSNFFENFYTYHPVRYRRIFIPEVFKFKSDKFLNLLVSYKFRFKPLVWSDYFFSRTSTLLRKTTRFNRHVFADFFDYIYENRLEKNVKYNRRLSYFNKLYWNLMNFNDIDGFDRFKKIPNTMDKEDLFVRSKKRRLFLEHKPSRFLTNYIFKPRSFFLNNHISKIKRGRILSFSTHSQFVRFIYKFLFNFYFIFIKPILLFFFYPVYFVLFYFLGVVVVFFIYLFFLRIKFFIFLYRRFSLMYFLGNKKKTDLVSLNLDNFFDEESEDEIESELTLKSIFLEKFLKKYNKLKMKKKFNYLQEIFKLEILKLNIKNLSGILILLIIVLIYFVLTSIFFSIFFLFFEIFKFLSNCFKLFKLYFKRWLRNFWFFFIFSFKFSLKYLNLIFFKVINVFRYFFNWLFLFVYLPIYFYRVLVNFSFFFLKLFWFFFVFFSISFYFFLYFESFLDLKIQDIFFKKNFQDVNRIYDESQIFSTGAFKNTYAFGFEDTSLSHIFIVVYILLFIYFLSLFFNKFNDNFLKSPYDVDQIYQEDSGEMDPDKPEENEYNEMIFQSFEDENVYNRNLQFALEEKDFWDFNIISVWHEFLKKTKMKSFFLYKIIPFLNSEVYFFNNFRFLIMNLDFNRKFVKNIMLNEISFNSRNFSLLTKKKIRLLLVFLFSNKQFFYLKFTKKNLENIFYRINKEKLFSKEKRIKDNILLLIMLKNLEFYLFRLKTKSFFLDFNSKKRIFFFNKNLSKKELKLKFTSLKIKLVLKSFKYTPFMFNNIRIFEENSFFDATQHNLNKSHYFPINSRPYWSLHTWYKNFNGRRSKNTMPTGSFYFWTSYVGFFNSHVFSKNFTDSLRFILNKWKLPRIVYNSKLDMFFNSANETRFFKKHGYMRTRLGTLYIKSVSIYFPYGDDEFFVRIYKMYLSRDLKMLYRFSSDLKNQQTYRNFKMRQKELFRYNIVDLDSQTFYFFELYVKSFLYLLKNKFYFSDKSLYKVLKRLFRLTNEKKRQKKEKKGKIHFMLRLKRKKLSLKLKKNLEMEKENPFYLFDYGGFLRRNFVFFIIKKRGKCKIFKRKRIVLRLFRKDGRFIFGYSLKSRKAYKQKFASIESSINRLYNNEVVKRKKNIFGTYGELVRFEKIKKFKLIIRRKNIGIPFIKNLKMIYINLQGKTFILIRKVGVKCDFNLGYVLFLLRKRNLWFDRFDFNFKRHIRRATLVLNYDDTFESNGMGLEEFEDEEYFFDDLYFPYGETQEEELDNFDEHYILNHTEHPFSELFLEQDSFVLSFNTPYFRQYNEFSPLDFFEFTMSFNQSDKNFIYDSFWLSDLIVDRCFIDSISGDSILTKDRFLVSNLSIYSKFLNFKNYSLDFDSLLCESNLLRNFIFQIWNKIPNTVIRNFFDFRLLRYSYPFLNPTTTHNFDFIWPAQKQFNKKLLRNNVKFPLTQDLKFNLRSKVDTEGGWALFERGFFFLIFYNPYNKFFLNSIKEHLGLKIFPISGNEIYSNQYKRIFFSNVENYIDLLSLKTYPDLNKEEFERVLAFFGCTAEEWDSIDDFRLNLKRVYDNWEFPLILWLILSMSYNRMGNFIWGYYKPHFDGKSKIETMAPSYWLKHYPRSGHHFYNSNLIDNVVATDINGVTVLDFFFKSIKGFFYNIFNYLHEIILLKNSMSNFQKFNLFYSFETIERFLFYTTSNYSWLDFVNFVGVLRSFFFFLSVENNFVYLGILNESYYYIVYFIILSLVYLYFLLSFLIFFYTKCFLQFFFIFSNIFDLSLINFGFIFINIYYLFCKCLDLIIDFIYFFIF